MLHALQTRRVDRAFTARVEAGSAVRMRAHLAGCERCRKRYERHLIAEAALPDGEARAEERLWREVTSVAGAPSGVRAQPRLPWRPGRLFRLAPALVAAAGLVLVLGGRWQGQQGQQRPQGHDDGFVARGGGTLAPGALAPSLHVFHAVGGAAAEPVGQSIGRSDGLLFAYSNPGARYSHLMVFALDERQRVYWYYPAYEQAGQNPAAVPIAAGRAGVELAEVIRHPLPAGRVRLFALFLPHAERVLAVEAAVAAAYGGASIETEVTLGLPGARQESRLFEVQP